LRRGKHGVVQLVAVKRNSTNNISENQEAWQLKLFRKSLKKQQKLKALEKIIGENPGQSCLLITCGDNNGALNWYLRNTGGNWSWVDAEQDSIAQISEITGDEVTEMDKDNPSLPFPDHWFDVIVTIDVHEHLLKPEIINKEIARLIKPGGRVIVTTPNGDKDKSVTRLKHLIGMRPEDYGHIVIGYDVPQLREQMEEVGLTVYQDASYAKFFTELLELGINFTYVKILSKRSDTRVEKGQITPQNLGQIKSVEKSMKLYSFFYPVFLVISKLDILDRSPRGYAVIVAARND